MPGTCQHSWYLAIDQSVQIYHNREGIEFNYVPGSVLQQHPLALPFPDPNHVLS